MHYSIPITQRLKKLIKSLHQKQARDENGLFIAEGEKLCSEILEGSYQTELIIVRDSPIASVIDLADRYSERGIPVYSAQKHLFDQICETKSPQGILAVVNIQDKLPLENESFVALDGISDPGNVGTIIRTADWFGYKQIILGKGCADAFNPKTVRSTMGSVFKMHIIQCEDLPEFCKTVFPKHKLYGADVNSEASISKIKVKGSYGVIFGSESHGISPETSQILDSTFVIDGKGKAESLNVAVSVGISLYHLTK